MYVILFERTCFIAGLGWRRLGRAGMGGPPPPPYLVFSLSLSVIMRYAPLIDVP